jgi:iron complex outermembrane receptor protein
MTKNHKAVRRCRHLPAVPLACLLCAPALAQNNAAEKELAPVVVSATRSVLDPNLPATVETRTVEQLREQNFINVEDALRHMPSMTIRKRYIGDRNSLIGGRSFSELQAPRGLVYADGYLLSQFLGQFNAPRWNMVAPEELARVDVFYGPFSALYPGNSIGTTVALTTRQPQRFEGSARVQAFTQDFDDAGFSGSYSGHQESAWFGNKVGALGYTVGVNRLKNKSQPMQYLGLQTPTMRGGAAVPVSGAVAALDPAGKPWWLAGPIGSAIEDNTQEQIKLKLGFDFSSTLYGEAVYAYWHNEGRRHGASILRNAAGAPVYAGLVEIDGVRYEIPVGAFSPQRVEEEHGMLGLTLKTRNKTGWNTSAIATVYDIGTDSTRTANGAPPQAYAGGSGTYADNSGTGWNTLDLQAAYTPGRDEAHAPVLGYHVNHYELDNRTFNTADWIGGTSGSRISAFAGKTTTSALYAQDSWKLAPRWLATLGLRYEQWKAYDGRRDNASTSVPYARREESAWSPKASLSWQAGAETVVRASLGKGVRFPTVSELFQGSISGNSLINNNPGLKPERSLAKELTLETAFAFGASNGTVRASLFEDDVRDTILSQTNTQVLPNITNIQNIGRVRTRGLELAATVNDFLLRGLELGGNIAYAHSKTLENDNNPATVGKNWVRVPRWRGSVSATHHSGERWTNSVALRHSGRQYNTLDNSDINPNTYAGTSSYTVWDLKTNYRFHRHLEASFGINNLFDRKYYVFHPYPGRTLFGELHASF